MAPEPTYEELLQKVNALEEEKRAWLKDSTVDPRDVRSARIELEGAGSLGSIINIEELQSIMDDFHYLTGMVTAILDMNGTVIEATGWQDICTKFHRIHPATARNCTESDLYLVKNIKPGEFVEYQCKNGLWDVATPLYIGNNHLGNIYTGQFFYDDDAVDEERFIAQAQAYGFDKDAYLDAFRHIPRYSRDVINHLMSFLVKFTSYISNVGYAKLKLEMEIQERKVAETSLRQSQEQLSQAMRMARTGHWEYDVASDTFTFNDHFYRIFRTTAEEVGGYHMSSAEYARRFCHPDDAHLVAQEVQTAIESPDSEYSPLIEHRILFADGEVGHIAVRFFITKDDQGRTIRTFGVNQDITERKHAEEERKNLQDQLLQAQKLESVGRLAGGVAHDLNNLLTPILGYSDMLREETAVDDPAWESLDAIVDAGMRARDLVQQLLAFSRKQLLEYKTIDLNRILAGFESLLRRTIAEDIHIAVILSSAALPVTVDIRQIEQVILNLAINAADAMQGGGTITIETTTVRLDETHARVPKGIEPGTYALLTISDTGHGMDEETRAQVFEPFFSTKGDLGTGLGLSTVYGIVKQHGGNIRVHTQPGEGTTFTVYLPLNEGEITLPDGPRNGTATAKRAGTETILLVEDNKQVRALTYAMLKREGYTVITAENGQDALIELDRHEKAVHLLLTDVVMPEMNGMELFAKANEKHPGLKVLFMSGYTDNVIANYGGVVQGAAFIQKPFTAKVLSAKLRSVLDAEMV